MERVARGGSIPGIEHLERFGEVVIDYQFDRGGGGLLAPQASDQHVVPWGSMVDPATIGFSMFAVTDAKNIDYVSQTGYSARALSVEMPIAFAGNQTGVYPGIAQDRPIQIQMSDIPMPRLSNVVVDSDVTAFYISALVSKKSTVNLINAYTGLFLVHGPPGGPPILGSFSDPRVGWFGDGNLGMRFGSIGCPNGNAALTSESAIDAGSVQPSVLTNPGANWFKLAIKVVPATIQNPLTSVAGYLDDQLVGTMSAAANMPRGRGGNAGYNFSNINAVIAHYQPLVVPQRSGLWVRKIHYYWTTDLSV